MVRAMIEDIVKSDLKTILHSKRANLYYLEKCRIMQKDGRIVYLTETKKENLFWNIPIANTTVILLGSGTSVTQAAMRLLSGAGVLVGFCGGGATPLFAGTEVEWLNPQSEYRPTEYVQGWLSFWFDEKKRLAVAKEFQKNRIRFLQTVWDKDNELADEGFFTDDALPEEAISVFKSRMEIAGDVTHVLAAEAEFTKKLTGMRHRIRKQSISRGSVILTSLRTGCLTMGIIWRTDWRQRLSGYLVFLTASR